MSGATPPLTLHPPHSVKIEKTWSPAGIPQLVQHAAYLQRNRDSIPAGTRSISVLYTAQIEPVALWMDSRGYFRGHKVAGGGITTRYGLDSLGNESRRWRNFPHPSKLALGAYPASYTMGNVSFPGVKRSGCDVDHPPYLAKRLKKEQSYTSTPPMGLRGLL